VEEVHHSTQSNAYTEKQNAPLFIEKSAFTKHLNVLERTKNFWVLHLVFFPWFKPMYYLDIQHRQYSVTVREEEEVHCSAQSEHLH
jgi:hypothetical protein